MKKILLIFCSLGFLTCTTDTTQTVATTVILVRHAEKVMDDSKDPGLTAAGLERANTLAEALKEVEIHGIYSTPFVRTIATVTPLAQQKNLDIEKYDPSRPAQVQEIIKSSPGQTLIFSGHSNTIPQILNVLTQTEDYQQLNDNDYDNLYIVFTEPKGSVKVLTLQYGEPSHF